MTTELDYKDRLNSSMLAVIECAKLWNNAAKSDKCNIDEFLKIESELSGAVDSYEILYNRVHENDKDVALEMEMDSQRLKFKEAGCKSQSGYMRLQEEERRQR